MMIKFQWFCPQVYSKQVQLFRTPKLIHQTSPGATFRFGCIISIFYPLSTLVLVLHMVKAVNVTVMAFLAVLLADCTAISFVLVGWVELSDQLGKLVFVMVLYCWWQFRDWGEGSGGERPKPNPRPSLLSKGEPQKWERLQKSGNRIFF